MLDTKNSGELIENNIRQLVRSKCCQALQDEIFFGFELWLVCRKCGKKNKHIGNLVLFDV